MQRGAKMPPYRAPAGGYATFPSPDLYAHKVKALNGLARYANNTSITLQPGQVGRPMTKPLHVDPAGCEIQLGNGLPHGPWIDLRGDGTYLPKFLGGHLGNTFALNGTTDRGANCRQRGFKNVQAGRQWPGAFGWTVAGCPDTVCSDHNYLSYQASAPQTKYRTLNFSAAQSEEGFGDVTSGTTWEASGSGSISVGAQTSLLSNSVVTTETGTDYVSGIIVSYTSGGAGYKQSVGQNYDPDTGLPVGDPFATGRKDFLSGGTTAIDGNVGKDLSCANAIITHHGSVQFPAGQSLSDLVSWWNSNFSTKLPAITDLNNYSGTATDVTGGGNPNQTRTISIAWTRTLTSYSWSFSWVRDSNEGLVQYENFSSSGSATLSDSYTSADVYADKVVLMGYWDMSDDAQYPPRTDGVWQIAPFVNRDEAAADISPLVGFIPATLDDKRSPVEDMNGNSPFTQPLSIGAPPDGWTNGDGNNDNNGRVPTDPAYSGPARWQPTYSQMTWFDQAAYGFVYGDDPVANHSGAQALDYKQFAKTGKILGMPMPRAFSDSDSYWYNPSVSVGGTVCFENFFDYHARLEKSCLDTDDGSADLYTQGIGEWLSDAIARTGAQLPFCATQWTNNSQAKTVPPYASIIAYDKQTYSSGAVDVLSGLPNVFAQKFCEIPEIWPSQDFFRPAGADKFVFDETKVYCVTNASGSVAGSTWNLTDNAGNTPADGLDVSGTWGGPSVGGFYTGCSYSGGVVTLGTLALNVPSDWLDVSGDGGVCFGKLRFSTAPSLLGRAAVNAIADGASHAPFSSGWTPTYQFATAQTNFGMSQTTSPVSQETVDFYDASMTLLSGGAGDTATRATDSTFTASVGYPTATYVMIHGAPDYKWDDNLRKGDFAVFQWLFDYRTAGEIVRLASVTDCAGNNPPSGGPTANNGYQAPEDLGDILDGGDGNTLAWSGDNFQAQGTIHYKPCSPCVICCSPNGETFPNGITIPFPTSFDIDSTYGSRWQLEPEQAMQDILWQGPHRPCGISDCDGWLEDDGTCEQNSPNTNCEGSGVDHHFAHHPYYEARTTLPVGAPDLPSGVTIGQLNPVDHSDGLTPPGWGGFNIATGNPNGFWTWWGYRYTIETLACPPGTCIYDYVDLENIACLSLTTSSPEMIQDLPLSGLGGLT